MCCPPPVTSPYTAVTNAKTDERVFKHTAQAVLHQGQGLSMLEGLDLHLHLLTLASAPFISSTSTLPPHPPFYFLV